MLEDTHAEGKNQVKEEFKQIVEAYNAAIAAGKVRAIRLAAAVAHEAILALAQKVRSLHPDQVNVLSELEAALMDVRWGRIVEVPRSNE